jgi:hypothetical protein
MNEGISNAMFPELPKKPTWFRFKKRTFTFEEMHYLGTQTTFNHLEFVSCPITDEQVRELVPLSRIDRLNLEGSKITDAALEDLAKLPKLVDLSLERTGITGEGLRFFHGHKALKTLRLTGTKVSDQTVGLAVGIPRLADLYLTKTSITFDGLLSLASHPTLTPQVSYFDQFAPEQEEAFRAAQRKLACKVDLAIDEDIAGAKQVLLAFFEAIKDWERRSLADSRKAPPEDRKAQTEAAQVECRAIFDRFCTKKDRGYQRPNGISYADPPTYSREVVVDAEQPSKSKVMIYTSEQDLHFQRRYLVIKASGEWRVDHRQFLMDRWKTISM